MAGKKKIKIGQNAFVEVNWNVLSSDYSKEKEKNIKVAFAKKYGIPESHVTVYGNIISKNADGTTSLNKNTIQDIRDPKFQQQLFVKYFDEHGITEYDLDEIIKIDGLINAQIDYDSYDKGKNYTVKWLDWDNFLSYGPGNHIDFTDFSGLILLNSIPSNQGGKSTFAYDLLHFLFFGKTRSGKMKTLDDLFNNRIPEATSVKVEGCINVDGQDYVIRRTLTRPALGRSKNRPVTQKVEYFRLLSDGTKEELADVENLGEENNVKTSQAIKEAIGNEGDFDLVISANDSNLKSLISLKETERGKLLNRWIGLLPLQDKDEIARKMWNQEINVNRYSNRYNRETLKNEIEECEKSIEEYQKLIESKEKTYKEATDRYESFVKTKDSLLSSKKQIDNKLLTVDVVTLDKTLENLKRSGLNKTKEKEGLEEQLKAFGDVAPIDNNVYRDAVRKKDELIAKMSGLREQIKSLQTLNKTLAESEYCPTCGRKYDNVDNTPKIKANEETIAKLTQDGINAKGEKEAIEKTINEMDTRRATLVEKNKVELSLSKLNVEIQRLRAEWADCNSTKKEILANQAAIEENNKLDISINLTVQNMRVEEQIKNDAYNDIIVNKRNIEDKKAAITERKIIIDKINEEEKVEKNWKLYLAVIGKDGISKMILKNTLPIINSELKRYLDGVCDFDVEVFVDEKNDVEFTMTNKNDGVTQRLAAGSGFEQTAASLALRVVLGNMSALSKPPFLVLDEILGGVAKENYDNMRKLYDKISQNFQFCMQISHLTDIIDWHNRIITVSKNEKNISKIELT